MKTKRTIKTPPITQKQKEILLYLYKFRFLNTHHIQQLFGHKNPNRTLAWMKDLIEKGCIKRTYERHDFAANTKPALYYLGAKARHILIQEKNLELKELEYIYKEHRREQPFINHCLTLANIYIFLLSQKEEKEDLKFFTKFELNTYEYFPHPLPDAFIAVIGEQKTRRYFLDYFDDTTPLWVMRRRVKQYLEYSQKSDWEDNTNHTLFPSILFVLPNESIKKHIYKYSILILKNTYADSIQVFLATKTAIQTGNSVNVWQKVE